MLKRASKKFIRQVHRSTPDAAAAASRAWAKARRVALTVAGFASIDYCVFELADKWGWLAVGLSFLAVEYLSEGDDKDGDE